MARGLLLVAGLCGLVAAACGSGERPKATAGTSAAQALRTCVDRWNQDIMVGWGSRSVRIAIRGLGAGERSSLRTPNPERRLCTVSLADRPGDNTWICQIGRSGGYGCPLVTSDGMPPLRNANGRTDRHGVLKLDVRLKGTQAAPPLPWQRRYPHVDGFIFPWGHDGRLKAGLRFTVTERGACGFFVEHVLPRSAGRCVDSRTSAFYEPCFPQGRTFRAGDLAACGAPGDTTFIRWRVTGRF